MIAKISALLLVSFLLIFATQLTAQQTDHDLYAGLYQKGEFDKALIVLKRLSKQGSPDSDVWYYLGLTYLKVEKEKDAVKALEKAAALKRDDPAIRTSLAYAYLLRNDNKAWDEATAALKLDPNIAEAHYILGVSSLRSASYNVAYERAKKAIALNPKFTNAYLLKSQALISSFAQQSGTVIRPVSSRGEMLQEAAGDLEKYLSLGPKITNIEFYKDYFESIIFFAEFYNRPENQKPISFDPAPVDDPKVTPLKITAKPRANYTDGARTNGISGIVRLLVGFSADGTIKHILILKSLDSGLDRNAVAAARQIRFEPKQIDGKPVSVVRVVEYSFTVY